jgi:hypothetical protein
MVGSVGTEVSVGVEVRVEVWVGVDFRIVFVVAAKAIASADAVLFSFSICCA